MTQDEIIRMAREAGGTEMRPYDYGVESDRFIMLNKDLERFYQMAFAAGAAHEREVCAKVCEKAAIQMNYSEAPYKQCAAAIRARVE